MRRSAGVVAAALAVLVGTITVVGAGPGVAAGPTPKPLILGAEDNRLVAYDPATGQSEVALGSAADDPGHGLDLNAQVCADPSHPGYFIAGEDTLQGTAPEFEPGWGYLKLTGTSLDDLDVTMEGNLVPTYVTATDNPENYGCGFLSDGRLVTTDVGDQQPLAAATGQLIVWFPNDDGFIGTDFDHCKVDIAIPTAGGIHVDGQDRVYVAANRPGIPGNLDLGGIYRYSDLPESMAQCSTRTDPTGAPLVDEGVVAKSLFILGDPVGALTPSAIVGAPGGGFYVSSVLTGVIAEYTSAGRFVRRVLEPPLLDPLPPHPGGTPYGMAVAADGSLWYADMGVELTLPSIGPVDESGTVRRIRFVDGEPQAPETVRSGLTYPDGLGVVPLVDAASATPTDPSASSEWGCGSWGMYGGNVGRTFSTECPSAIGPSTAPTMVPAWTVPMPRTVTASPAVVEGTVYVGDWSGTMYALRLTNGTKRWTFQTEDSPGAAFGPIVSSAAVADVQIGSSPRRLVIFGAGPRLYALDAATGTEEWVVDRSMDLPSTPAEFESSPVVHGGVVYVGLDTHNQPEADTGGVKGGLLALDAATGDVIWEFHPELAQPGVGCGSVWSSPTVDTDEQTVLLATGNCTAPASEFTWNSHTEALTALDLATGAVRWSFQPHAPNRDDLDFGATPNVISRPDGGGRLIGIGNKDATYYAVDPHDGHLVWKRTVAIPGNLGEDFAVGGFIGSTATWRGDVYGSTAIGGPPWYHALDGADGSVKWAGLSGPGYAASAVVNGVVFSGDLAMLLKGFDAASGLPLFVWPLLGPISSAPAIAGDTLVIGSGTSASDLCGKGTPGAEECALVFQTTLGSLGSVTAFRPLTLGRLLP